MYSSSNEQAGQITNKVANESAYKYEYKEPIFILTNYFKGYTKYINPYTPHKLNIPKYEKIFVDVEIGSKTII